MSRRTLLGAGLTAATVTVAAVAAREAGVLDDALRAAGARPHPEPDPGDTRRLRRAATTQAGLLAALDATAAEHPRLSADLRPLRVLADEQLVAVGGRLTGTEVPVVPTKRTEAVAALARVAADAAESRQRDALAAASPDVALVLASMSAGLSQLSRRIGVAS